MIEDGGLLVGELNMLKRGKKWERGNRGLTSASGS